MIAAAVTESGGTRVVRRMLFEADDMESAATANCRRFSLPLNSVTAATDRGRQLKTPTKCNYH